MFVIRVLLRLVRLPSRLALLHVQLLQLPVALLVRFAEIREAFAHQNAVRQRTVLRVSTFPRFYPHRLDVVVVEHRAGEIVAQNRVALAQQRAEMRVHRDYRVVLAEMVGAADGDFLETEPPLVAGVLLCALRVEGDAEDGVFDEGLGREERAERRVVELLDVELGALQREGVDQEEQVGDLVAETERVHALEITQTDGGDRDAAELARQHDEVVLADGEDVHDVAVLVLHHVRGEILAQQLPRRAHATHHSAQARLLHGNHALQPENEGARVAALGEVEVQAVGLRLDQSGAAMHVRLDDLLLQEEERALVLHLLTQLHDRSVRVLDRVHDAVLARLGFDDERHHERLLKDHVEYFFLDRHVHFDTAGVGLCPHELCINQLHLLQTYAYRSKKRRTSNLFQA